MQTMPKASRLIPIWYLNCTTEGMEHPPGHENTHGPENAEHELKKAYNLVIETGVTHFWDRRGIVGVGADEVVSIYKTAFRAYRDDDKLSAERWARAAKHLARACWHEAKIAYLEPRVTELPFLDNALEEYRLHDYSDTTSDLLESLADHIPPGHVETPEEMTRYLLRARKHLAKLEESSHQSELLKAERIKAAHEYGRVLECLALAYEAENRKKPRSAA